MFLIFLDGNYTPLPVNAKRPGKPLSTGPRERTAVESDLIACLCCAIINLKPIWFCQVTCSNGFLGRFGAVLFLCSGNEVIQE